MKELHLGKVDDMGEDVLRVMVIAQNILLELIATNIRSIVSNNDVDKIEKLSKILEYLIEE